MKAIATLPKRSRTVRTQRQLKPLRTPSAVKRLLIKKILVPIDFSPFSHRALKFALPWLRRFDAELHLVHVVAADVPLTGLAAMPIVLSETESADRVRSHLRHVARDSAVEFETANIHVLRGNPFHEICRLAREIDIDLIIMPTHGQTGFKHLLLGSTAEHVVRYSPCPVLVLKSHLGAGGNGKVFLHEEHFKKILVPIDFSDCSKKGLGFARVLAKQFDSTLVLLHSVHLDYYVASDEYARYDFPLLLEQTEKAAAAKLRDLVRQTNWEGVKVETLLETGHAGQQICYRALDRHAGLIVTSTHGRTGLKHMLIGSTAEYVVRHADCPVLVVPSHDRPVVNSTKNEI